MALVLTFHPRNVSRMLIRSVSTKGVSDVSKRKEPLVVILPWMFSKPKQVDKYVQMYQRKGYKKVVVIPSSAREVFFPHLFMNRRRQVTDNLLFQANESSCLILHALSVGTLRLGNLLMQMDHYANQNHGEKNRSNQSMNSKDRNRIDTHTNQTIDKEHLVNQFKSKSKSILMDSPTEPGVLFEALGYASFPGKMKSSGNKNGVLSNLLEQLGWLSVKVSMSFLCKVLFPPFYNDVIKSLRFIEVCKNGYNFNSVVIVSSRSDLVVDYKYCFHLARSLLIKSTNGQKLSDQSKVGQLIASRKDWIPQKYKKSDNLISGRETNELISEREISELISKCEKEKIIVKIFDKSPHVSHWMTHREIYEKLVDFTIKSADPKN